MILNCSPVGFGLFAGSVLATGGVAAVLPWEIAFVGWLTRGHSLKSAVKDLGSTGLMNIRGIIREFEVKEKEICRDKSRAEDCKLIRQSIQNQKRAESDLKNYEQQQAKRNWEEYDEYYYDLITTLNSEDIFTPEVKSLFPVSQNKFKPGFGKNVFSALLKNPSTTLQRTNGSVQSATIILNGKTRTIGLTSQTAIGRDEDPELAFVMALSAVDEFMTRHKSEYTSLLQFAPYLERMSLALKAYLATLPESHALRSELEILANDAHDMILRLNPNPYAENAKISEREVASKRTRHYQKTTSKKKAH